MTMIGLRAVFTVSNQTPKQLEAAGDEVMRALLEQEATDCGILDSAVALDLGERQVEIELTAEADSFEHAQSIAEQCLRRAIETAGGHVPQFAPFETQAMHTELVPAG